MKRSYLALDLGAESGRAMLAHLAGGKVELAELHRFANTPVRLPTGLYWDTLRLFHEICEGIRAAQKTPINWMASPSTPGEWILDY